MIQEVHDTSDAIRDACSRAILGHAATLVADIEAARQEHGISGDWTAESLARHTQAVLQGAFILAKAGDDSELARESVDHLDRYVRQLFNVPERRPAMTQRTDIGCACGQTEMVLEGGPILAATCHCNSCREAAEIFASLDGPEVRAPDGGTPFVVWRSDRARLVRGAENLREHRLKPESSTRRVVATCCHAPMYLQFTRGHWLSLYAGRFAAPPPSEMRTMLEDLGPGAGFDDGIPAAQTQSAAFMWRLLKAWVAMGFRTPKPEAMPKLEV